MSLKWPLALLLTLLPIAALFYRRQKPVKRGRQFVAETAMVQRLPSYKKRSQHAKRWRLVERGLLATILLVLVALIARPQQSILKINEEKSHDVVLCLDASGSMAEYISDAVTVMGSIADKNRTDRFSIVIFQNSTYTILPLTRDTVAIQDRVKFLQEGFKAGSTDSSVQSLGYDSSNYEVGTDITNALIGCVKRFDNLTKDKSRNLIMISDLEHNGPTDYLEAAQLLPKYKIKSFVLTPDFQTETIKNSEFTAITNASVGGLQDTTSVVKLLEDIFRQILNVEESKSFTKADNPQPFISVLLILALMYGFIVSKRWRSI